MTTPEEYDRSFTAEAVAAFRAQCREAAASLARDGRRPEVIAEKTEVVAVERSFLGIKRSPEYRSQSTVILRGWNLKTVTTAMGNSGPEWFMWTVSAALGTDGLLYRVERRREENNGRPTSSDGSAIVRPLNDLELRLFDVYSPEKFGIERPVGYHGIFPAILSAAVDSVVRQ